MVCDRPRIETLQRCGKEKALNSAQSCQGRLPRGGDISWISGVNRKENLNQRNWGTGGHAKQRANVGKWQDPKLEANRHPQGDGRPKLLSMDFTLFKKSDV